MYLIFYSSLLLNVARKLSLILVRLKKLFNAA